MDINIVAVVAGLLVSFIIMRFQYVFYLVTGINIQSPKV
ncbi:MAG: hypothetical protein RLZZ234_513 [Candidatus Parcubacteria bacterium]|jgi:hypothetical protein